MVRWVSGVTGLPIVALVAMLASPAAAEPLQLGPEALDRIAAGGGKQAKALQGLQGKGGGTGLAELALKLAGRQRVVTPTPTPTPPESGLVTVKKAGKKTFKADRVTKGHRETLVVSGSIVR